jgi:hypothetical protein
VAHGPAGPKWRKLRENLGELLTQPGAVLFEPTGGRPLREYVVVPEAVLDDRAAPGGWLSRGLGYTERKPWAS